MIRILILILLVSCHDSAILPGATAPSSITKEILSYDQTVTPGLLADKDFQQQLEHKLENKLWKTDKLKLFQNGDSFSALMGLVASSKKYFFMNVLSFDCDSTTEPFVKALEEKAHNGTDVRLITNKFFGLLTRSCLQRLESSGIKVSKSRTHSSYFLNDQKEILIGSQSVARMFFKADGFNSLDRDMMLFASGNVVTDALHDFSSNWIETEGGGNDLIQLLSTAMTNNGTDISVPGDYCRFTAERPAPGVQDIQTLWQESIKASQHNIIFSGVRVEVDKSPISDLLKTKSKTLKVSYIGNGLLSGNGELTMVLNEWIKEYPFFSGMLNVIKEWDSQRVARDNKDQYLKLMVNSNIDFHTYYQFIHYKVWSFDYPAFFIGSANVDESKFGKVSDAGLFCLSENIYKDLISQLDRDFKNSTRFEVKK